jgi:tape measure domain-containing protein
MATVRELVTKWGFDVDGRPLDRMETRLRSLKRTALITGAAVTAAATKIGFLVNESAKMEQTKIAFEVLLGSVEEADQRLKELFDFAKKTPFTIPGILDAGKQLLAYGIESRKLVSTLNILGNISAAVGTDKLPRLTLALGQVRAATKLRGQELRQFTEAGVNLLDELGKILGKTAGEVQDMVSKGHISFDLVEQALTNLTTGSGRFANLMVRQSKTFLGLLSNIKDALQILAAEIGDSLLPTAKEIAKEFLTFLEANKEIIKVKAVRVMKVLAKFIKNVFIILKATTAVLGVFIKGVGGLENAIKLLTIAISAFLALNITSFIGTAILTFGRFIGVLRAATVASLALNAAVAALPIAIGAIVVAIGLIIEDIVRFFRGEGSVTEIIVEAFKKAFDNVMGWFEIFADKFISMGKNLAKMFIDTFNPVNVAKRLVGLATPTNLANAAGFVSNAINPGSAIPTIPQSNNQSSQQIKVDSPITVNVPEGTPANEVGPHIQTGIKTAFDDLFRTTFRDNKPVVAY